MMRAETMGEEIPTHGSTQTMDFMIVTPSEG